jgi:hypothetical protein
MITEHSEVGYTVPFRFRYYAAAPSRYFEASFDGKNYTNCHLNDDGDLVIGLDNHNLGCGILMVARTYYLNDQNFSDGVCDEAIAPAPVVIQEENEQGGINLFNIRLGMTGETQVSAQSVVAPYYAIGPQGPQGPEGPQGPQGVSGGFLFPVMNFNPETGVLTISGLEQEIDRVRYDYATAELIIRLYN